MGNKTFLAFALLSAFLLSASGALTSILIREKAAHRKTREELAQVKTSAAEAGNRIIILENDILRLSGDLETLREHKNSAASPAQNKTGAPTPSAAPEAASEKTTTASPAANYSVQARVSAIGKFVSLNEDQRARLKQKFESEMFRGPGEQAETETLDQILGKDSADFYREQRRKAFEKVKNEALEKEVLLMVRRLSLDSRQEEELRRSYAEIETEIEKAKAENTRGGSSSGGMFRRMLEEDRQRNALLTEKIRTFLTPEQYRKFLEEQNASAGQELQLWHGPE